MYYSSKNFGSPLHTSSFPQLLYNSPKPVFFDMCSNREIWLDCLPQLESSYTLLHEKFLAQAWHNEYMQGFTLFHGCLSTLPYNRSVTLFYYAIALTDCALREIKKRAFLTNKE